jgi:hypothetical protein
MSNSEMADMCVKFLLENHQLITDEQLEMLDCLWNYKYEAAAAAAEQPLPPSPPPEPEDSYTPLLCRCDGDLCDACYKSCEDEVLLEALAQQGLCPSCSYQNPIGHQASCLMCGYMAEAQAQAQPQVQAQVQNQLVQPQLAEQPDTDGEDEVQVPKKPRNPIYTSYQWPSPIAKVFVQQIRGNNPWQYRYKGSKAWPSDFKGGWLSSGNTEFKLTHDNCMRYLAHRMGRLTIGQLMEKTPREVHAKLIGEYHGVPGYYTKRLWF